MALNTAIRVRERVTLMTESGPTDTDVANIGATSVDGRLLVFGDRLEHLGPKTGPTACIQPVRASHHGRHAEHTLTMTVTLPTPT